MTEKDIVTSLMIYYRQYRYRINNVYVFAWESDFIAVTKSGYVIECEVKISRSDFLADIKKDKHKLLTRVWPTDMIPNRFMYVAPSGIIKPEEVPPYAGLMQYERMYTLKNPPLLHKQKYDLTKILCDKYFYKWLDTRNNLRKAIDTIEKYRGSLFGEKLIRQLKNAY
jgi:hypothetical protein